MKIKVLLLSKALISGVLSDPNKWRVQNSETGHKSFYYSAGRKSKGKDEREFSKSAVNSLVLLSLWLFVGLWGTRHWGRRLDDVEEKLKMLGRAGKGNRTRVESSQEGFYGQSIIFSMCNRCGRTMIPKILGIRKQPRAASVSTSFRCGRPILHCNSVFRNDFWNFPPFIFWINSWLGALTGLANDFTRENSAMTLCFHDFFRVFL